MDIHAWNRKDALPEDTIEKFKSVLLSVGIHTKVVEEENYKEYWYSNRIEIDGIETVGTNGKGVSALYAMASAFGEFLERLQSGMLTDYLFPLMRKQNTQFVSDADIKELILGIKRFFPVVCAYMTDDEIVELITISIEKRGFRIYEDILNKNKDKLPEYIIPILCGSNGIAAGNTFFEAFVQGISEVFERYVTQYIYKNNIEGIFSVIDEAVYRDLRSYRLIQAIEKRNYRVFVIDCSLKGKLPVIGTLIFDPGMSKYYFKLGSDADIDIALQRCITEVFQGNSFDLNFRIRMKDVLKINEKENGFWYGDSRKYEHTRAEVDGTGALPRAFLKCLSHKVTKISGFLPQQESNEDAAVFMVNCCRQFSENIAVTNYTTLGIPCLRILVPDMCESFYYPGENVSEVVKCIVKIRSLFQSGNLNSEAALDCMQKILDYPAYVYEFSMTKLLGIIIDNNIDYPYIYNPYLFTAYLALHLGRYQIAVKYFKISGKNARTNDQIVNIDLLLAKAIQEGVSEQEFLEFIHPMDRTGKLQSETRLIYSIRKSGLKVPACPNCNSCYFKGHCAYDKWEPIYNKLQEAQQIELKKEFEHFLAVLRNRTRE